MHFAISIPQAVADGNFELATLRAYLSGVPRLSQCLDARSRAELGPAEKTTPDRLLTLCQQISLLALLAFYTGIGSQTTLGLGQARLRQPS